MLGLGAVLVTEFYFIHHQYANYGVTIFISHREKNIFFEIGKIRKDSMVNLKYTIGMSSFHSCKVAYVEQEVYAGLLL